ncbi:ABC transporter substrate-binding protein [uncultured Pseudacidovorax sp.]|uniref:ABC transporter substrate-binding protein n=1 Tax=uncultured Pseudacidovorax sp. TaxID=679313 RepID=UPI0025D8F79A|nr:ABC transporter substrate-binding protein [uncultured Pseudacidovorax sp.]
MTMSDAFSRRHFLGAASSLTVGLALPARAAGGITSTVFGGVWEKNYRAAIVDSFEKKLGVKVALKLGTASEWLTNGMVNRARPEIDMLLLPYPDSIKAVRAGIGMPLSPEKIPNIRNVHPMWFDQFRKEAVGLDYVAYGIAYRTDLVKKPPQAWSDLWDPALKGRVTVPNIGVWGSWEMLVAAARTRGGDEGNLDPGFKALRELRPNIRRFFSGSTDAMQMLDTGEVSVVAMTTNIPAYALIDSGKPVKFVFPKDGSMVGMVSYHVARNTPNAELCMQFIDHALSKEAQEAFCNAVIAGPTNRLARLNGKAAERVPALEQLKLFDWGKVIPQMSEITDRWNQEIAG